MILRPRRRVSNRTVMHYTDASVFGGAEQMIVNLLASLDRERWDPVLVHHPSPGLAELAERARRLNVPILTVGEGPLRPAIGRLLRRTRPAIFHAHLNWAFACEDGLIGAALARTPGIVATQQLFVPPQSRRALLRHRLFSIAVDRFIAVSRHMGKALAVGVVGEGKVQVVHNGIPFTSSEELRPESTGPRVFGSEKRPIALTLARLVPQKGIHYLIEAATELPDVLFLVAGDGPQRAELERFAQARGLAGRVVFLGHRSDVTQLLARCDVFVLPSLYEGLPVAVLEAMAAGKPVVATRIGGTDEAVKDRMTGLLVAPADAGALAQAVRRVIADRRLAEGLGAQGRSVVRSEFSARAVGLRTMDIYESLVRFRQPSRASEKPLTNRPAAEGRMVPR